MDIGDAPSLESLAQTGPLIPWPGVIIRTG